MSFGDGLRLDKGLSIVVESDDLVTQCLRLGGILQVVGVTLDEQPRAPPAGTGPWAPLRIQEGRLASWEAVPAASWLSEPAPRAPIWHAKWYTGTRSAQGQR